MAIRLRAVIIVDFVLFLGVFYGANAGMIFDKFDGLFEDPFMLMYQNQTTCGHRRIMKMRGNVSEPLDDTESAAMAGEYPWQAAMLLGQNRTCTAVLIHESWLLTSAGCMPSLRENYTVIAGTLSLIKDIDGDVDTSGRYVQRRMTSGVFVHPKYDARHMAFDIALVKVAHPFDLNDHVNTVCLPHRAMNANFRPGTRASVAAWGSTEEQNEHLGSCPKLSDDIMDECAVEQCDSDYVCDVGQKCCSNGCVNTCMNAVHVGSTQEKGRGMLKKFGLPLLNHTSCSEFMGGALPETAICAGPMARRMLTRGEGGLISAMRRKMMMSRRNRGEGNADDNDEDNDDSDDESGDVMDISLMSAMSTLHDRIDDMPENVGARGRRRSGAWTVGLADSGTPQMTITGNYGTMRSGGREDDEMGDVGMADDGMGNDGRGGRPGELQMEKKIMKCKGDMGGPLVAEFKGQWYILGVTSLPYGCLSRQSPGLYSHVFKLRQWIRPIFNGKDPKGKSMDCKVGEFACGDGWCIPEDRRCDGIRDCARRTDERFCDGALKGFNAYFDHQLNETTVARTFPVRSADQCALACLKAPFLCPGFNLHMTSTQAGPSPPIPLYPISTDGDDEEGGERKMAPMMCAIADGKSTVHPVRRMDKNAPGSSGKGGLMPPVLFKLPRHAPCAAMFFPAKKLHLPRGLIVSPSYLLGDHLAEYVDDVTIAPKFMKVLIGQLLMAVSSDSCVVEHDQWKTITEMKMKATKIRKTAMAMMKRKEATMMGAGGGGGGEGLDDGSRRPYYEMAKNMRMQLRQMKMNFTMIMHEVKHDCNKTVVEGRVKLKMREMMSNLTCMQGMADKGDERSASMPDPGERDMEETLKKLLGMDKFKMILSRLMMNNVYPSEVGFDQLMNSRGSMLGDMWSAVANDDVMSQFVTNMLASLMEGKESDMMDPKEQKMPGDMRMNLKRKANMLMKKMIAITSMLLMDKCNSGNKTEGIVSEDLGVFKNSSMGKGLKQKMMMKKKMRKEESAMGFRKWNIVQMPSSSNNIRGRVLAARGPMHCKNIQKDFGMVIARGTSIPKKMMIMKGRMVREMRRSWMMKGETLADQMEEADEGEDDMEEGGRPSLGDRGEETGGDADGMDGEAAMTDDEGGDMGGGWDDGMMGGSMPMTGTHDEDTEDDMSDHMSGGMGGAMGEDTPLMGGAMSDEQIEDIVMGMNATLTDPDVTGTMGMGRDDLARLLRGFLSGDLDKDTVIAIVGPERFGMFHEAVTERMLTMKLQEARGVSYCLSDVYPGKRFMMKGHVGIIEQYSTKAEQHGVIMEYDSGWSCNKMITMAPGVLTSPLFPMPYPSNALCNSLISAPPGHVVVLYMLRFDLQRCPVCSKDSLVVLDKTTDGWEMLGQRSFCGSTIPHIFRSSGQQMMVKFKSDDAMERAGFKAVYTFEPARVPSMIRFERRSDSMPTGAAAAPGGSARGNVDLAAEAGEQLRRMAGRLVGMKCAVVAVSSMLFTVVVVCLVVLYRRLGKKAKEEQDKEIFDTKL